MDWIYFFLAAIAAGAVGFVIGRYAGRKEACICETRIAGEDAAKKRENFQEIKEYIADKEKFTNDDLQNFLKVSNTTVGRYLQELEESGKIKQVGNTGRFVYYTKV